MSVKYHIPVAEAPHRFAPVSKFNAIEIEGCLGCRRCVKRESCVYGVYRKRRFDPDQIVDTGDSLCVSCMRCVQECRKHILTRVRNPEYARLGDAHWKPDLIAALWSQAATGKIPVSGAGYRGPFAGPGFDRMWTDLSEIVRPTRDGIHGREYISTVIELGRRPAALEFDSAGRLTTAPPRFIEIPIPLVLSLPPVRFVTDDLRRAVAQAAGRLGTLAAATLEEAQAALADHRPHLIVRFDSRRHAPDHVYGLAMVELADAPDVMDTVHRLKAVDRRVVVAIRLALDGRATLRAAELAGAGAEVLHLQADDQARGFGTRRAHFATELVREVHRTLLERGQRDQLTLLASGGIAAAEHIPKIIACGADGVVVDRALLAALECRLCRDCPQRIACPVRLDEASVDWAAQRIVNLIGAWHSQLIEVMGAMGLREVRRLRGELGRVMFFEELEEENFGPLFGRRVRSLVESLADGAVAGSPAPSVPRAAGFPPAQDRVARCPSRFRNALGRYLVVRTAACTGCGKCVEVCAYGVHRSAGGRLLAPKSHLCQGPEACAAVGLYCVNQCPAGALRVGPDPAWETFGDARWPAALLVATWRQAESGRRTADGLEYRTGASGGGFDRLDFVFPAKAPRPSFRPEEVDLRVRLNRRPDDGRPAVTLGIPFYGGGMSYGSVSLATMVARARAYTAFDSFTCTGEGGYPDELKPYDDHVITQVATGLFGVREETIQRVRLVEFKYAQGAKPGLGGHLLGDKVTPAVARMREAVPGVSLFSPFPFHSVYSVEDHKKHVDWIKAVNPRALVSVKVSTASDVDMVAIGSYYAGAHIVHLDGSYGGTGAAPDIAKKNIAMPIEYAVPKVHRFLQAEGVRDQITLVASGGLRTAWDVAKVIALGADAAVIGTAELVALECIRCGVCESGRGCPRGIATTDPELATAYDSQWASQRLINLFHAWAVELQDILWRLGLRQISELVGRSDLLVHRDYERSVSPGRRPAAVLAEVAS